MKILFSFFTTYLFVLTTLLGQPQICITPPVNYEIGGDFDLYVTNLGIRTMDDYLCMNDKSQVVRIEAFDKSNMTDVRYIFGLDQSYTSLPVIPKVSFRDIDGSSSGEFWVVQWGKQNNKNVLSCKRIHIDIVEKPILNIKSCNEKSLELDIIASSIASNYRIDWGDSETLELKNSLSQISQSHEYRKIPGGDITVFAVNVNKESGKSCISPPTVIIPPHKFRIQKLSTFEYDKDMSATVEYENINDGSINLEYNIEKNSNFQSANSKLLSPGVVNQLPKQEVCFRLRYSNSPECIYFSPQVCSIKVESKIVSSNDKIELNWNEVNNRAIYEIFRQDSLIHTEFLNQAQFFDDELGCKEEYEYQIIGKYQDRFESEVIIESSTIKVPNNTKTKVEPVSTISATYQKDNIILNFTNKSNDSRYEIYRYAGFNIKENSTFTNSKPFYEVIEPYNEQVCYHVKSFNECGLSSVESPKVCTIYLEANGRILTWNKPAEIPNTSVSYVVKNLSRNSKEEIQETIFNIKTPNTVLQKFQILAIVTFNLDGKQLTYESESNIVEVEPNSGVYMPNTFTPNNDGKNDTFSFFGDLQKIKHCKFKIFNKWGTNIFESNDVDFAWDGTFQGVPLEKGIYTYSLNIIYEDGYEESKKGSLQLLR